IGDIDTVNLFNGNLNAAIPLGQGYHVGGNLSYGLALHYTGNAWDNSSRTVYVMVDGVRTQKTYSWSFPDSHFNAGFGWLVSLGAITHEDGAGAGFYTYESADGGKHPFYPSLHDSDCATVACPTNVTYTRDGTYLRLTVSTTNPNDMTLESPDGTISHFQSTVVGVQLT